jgi:hypothetical protein
MLTHGTAHGFHLVFRHHQAHDWQFVDLSALFDLPGLLGQLASARFAVARPMRDDLIGRFRWLQSVSWMPLLPPFRLATLLARLPLAFQTITGWWLAAVLALFRQPPFQFFQTQ